MEKKRGEIEGGEIKGKKATQPRERPRNSHHWGMGGQKRGGGKLNCQEKGRICNYGKRKKLKPDYRTQENRGGGGRVVTQVPLWKKELVGKVKERKGYAGKGGGGVNRKGQTKADGGTVTA